MYFLVTISGNIKTDEFAFQKPIAILWAFLNKFLEYRHIFLIYLFQHSALIITFKLFDSLFKGDGLICYEIFGALVHHVHERLYHYIAGLFVLSIWSNKAKRYNLPARSKTCEYAKLIGPVPGALCLEKIPGVIKWHKITISQKQLLHFLGGK